jgi:DNA-binding response OmpR family regulator
MVLILDDDAVSRRLISSCIERVGLRCIALFEPSTALKVLLGNPFDLIFLDVDMPGTNGFELCKELRNSSANKGTPVIFVTSLTNLESRALSIMSGADDYVRKPFCPAELAVRALLHLLNPRTRSTAPSADTSRAEPAALARPSAESPSLAVPQCSGSRAPQPEPGAPRLASADRVG